MKMLMRVLMRFWMDLEEDLDEVFTEVHLRSDNSSQDRYCSDFWSFA